MPAFFRSGKRPFLADAIAAALFLGGCLTNQTSDQPTELNGESSLVALEVDDMGQVSAVASGLLKKAVDSANVALSPLKFDGACECHVRSISVKTDGGYERERVDSVIFLDAEGKSLRYPTLARVKTVIHKRWVHQKRSGHEAEIHIVTGMTLNPSSPDTTGTWNGEVGGSYAGLAYHDGKITDVTRKLANRRWQFPSSGTLEVKSEAASLKVTYLGDGQADAVRTNALTGKTVTIHLDSGYREKL